VCEWGLGGFKGFLGNGRITDAQDHGWIIRIIWKGAGIRRLLILRYRGLEIGYCGDALDTH
jgi:hypothetical protein